ncbi:MAG: SMP-30/gluconolactonase/LRE family protein [Ferrovibrio sp.]|uniref:SMP-30/gluconolactonase/LRE family protein n=1 Tax=Ferrovibrio sp. TaxID=1917215 RepID=UPI0026070D41|nr:SMP-30/gluconolactonase/LRE family protein [Ferrovibrio sp.]MCW0235492.1 SMP-30/gluconolactonase/LRE family protein [Ferrovibrio sp.]
MWTLPTSRYPDPAVQVLDDSFLKLRLRTAAVERLATGFRWAEGPVWFGDQRCLIWSDIPNNQMLRWDEQTGAVSVFRKPSHYANGNTRDRQGRLITCEHETRRVTRTEYDGSITVLADRFEGKRFNSPNDVVVKSDGTVWFTDPIFGVNSNYESRKSTSELPQHVYRLVPATGDLTVVAEGLLGPNGLCFSPDESRLYIVESLAAPNRLIHAYDVVKDGKALANKTMLIDCGAGTSDGLRCDTAGNLWCGWGMGSDALDGVMVFNPDGRAIGRIALPERCANLCFGGEMRNRLFMASSQSLYALYVDTQGATLS